ncbi:hypothetical protein GUJ93_ZPchr0006g43826 [Zizania palustris]|uniref:Uncharacterized protein n=1 Tax=Zizania palustris TaxID=103762 RepID=A0A8J5W1M9_ZIZPA|nr:hypothetical protein GUJ93_ZPchr0006g43826 [Zizania palustris]
MLEAKAKPRALEARGIPRIVSDATSVEAAEEESKSATWRRLSEPLFPVAEPNMTVSVEDAERDHLEVVVKVQVRLRMDMDSCSGRRRASDPSSLSIPRWQRNNLTFLAEDIATLRGGGGEG